MGSLARASRDANVDAPRRHLGVFLLAHEVELGRPDIGVPGELAHLVERGAVTDGVVDGGLAERMDADAPAAPDISARNVSRGTPCRWAKRSSGSRWPNLTEILSGSPWRRKTSRQTG